jgi:hypothetical protein
MDAALHERPLGVQEAYEALDGFGRDMGRVRLLLLLHAAVPQSFRSDLLNLLKVNFLADEAGTDMTVDSDVMLSPLVQPAAAGYYRLDPEVRRHALALLDAAYRDRPVRRTLEVARFLLAYADALERQAGVMLDPLLAEYLAVQRWVALSFIDPHAAAEAFARALEGAVAGAAPAVALRLGSVTAAISVPLAGHEPLLAYARGVEAISRGNVDAGRRLLAWMRDGELRVGNVALRPPREVIERLTPAGAGSAAAAEAPAPRRLILIGVPDKEGIIAGHDAEVAQIRERLLARAPTTESPLPQSLRDDLTNVVAITGPDGIGKWTLANAVAHDRSVRQFFADGIVWLGEDGDGHPTAALREYASVVFPMVDVDGRLESDLAGREARVQRLTAELLDERGVINREGFRRFFKNRRVLFISEHRTAVNLYPVLASLPCPSCALLYLSPSPVEGVQAIELKPLDAGYAHAAFTRQLGGGPDKAWLRDQLIEFARGIPLLIQLVEGAVSQRGVKRQEEVAGELGDSNRWNVEEQVGQALRASWNSLSLSERDVLRQGMLRLPEGRTRFQRSELAGVGVASQEFISLVFVSRLADVLGETVRFHPLVRAGLDALVREGQSREAEAPEEREGLTDYVFISYAREDERAVQALREALHGAGVGTFIDRDLQPGAVFESELRRRIQEAAAFVPILSRAAVASSQSFHHVEWRQAIDEAQRREPSRRFVFPVAVDDVEPDEARIPERFRQIHWEHAIGAPLIDALKQAVRQSMFVRARPGEPESVEGAEFYALVIGFSRYPHLGINLERADDDVRAVHEWVTGRHRDELDSTRLRLIQSEDVLANPEALQREFQGVATVASRGHRIGRRLYMYASGLVGLAEGSTPVLVLPNATREQIFSVDLLEWVKWFRSAGAFDELVVWIDGTLVRERFSRAAPVPFTLPAQSRRPGALFVAAALEDLEFRPRTRASTEPNARSFTEYLLEALYGGATDERTGRVTSQSLAAALQNWPRRASRPNIQQPRIEMEGEIVFAEGLRPS